MTLPGRPLLTPAFAMVALLICTVPPGADAQTAAAKTPGAAPSLPAGLGLQVALDRAGFSPGAIDGAPGRNTRLALQRFQDARGLTASGAVDAPTQQALPAEPPTTSYTLTAEDLAGPFIDGIPSDMMEKRTLEVLAYTSPAEMLAERFHTTPRLLARLNPKLEWKAGVAVQVPNVQPFELPSAASPEPVWPSVRRQSTKSAESTVTLPL